ncbi:MAG: Fic family protein [Coxiellaceae bacterium]|nr:Fic family protein [Coxiellaceae bacterium]
MKCDDLTVKKQQLDALRPLPNALVHNLDDWFRVELTYTSNAIEGNTMTRRETALVVEKGLTVGGKTLVEHLEATNHAKALDWVKQQVKRKPGNLQIKDILHIHDVILKGIDDEHAGFFRSVPVRISGSTVVLPNPRKVPDLMDAFAAFLKQASQLHAVEFAAEVHYQLVTIHPFVDGNGRAARLLMNMILMMLGYPPAIIRTQDRLAYIASLEQAQLGGSKQDYYQLVAKAVDRSLDIYLQAMQGDSFSESSKKLLKIGEFAQQANENVSTIRHWVKLGLINVTDVTPAGYQLFAVELLTRVKKIQRLKQKRFTLKEILHKLDVEKNS